MLAYYAREFPFVEINFSYYRLPTQRTLAGMARKVPANFLFTVKAYQSLTHGRGETAAGDAGKFLYGLAPLIEEGRLGAVLLQFPYSFHSTGENRRYLARLKELLPGVPLVVEFRNRGWAGEPVWEFLTSLGMGYVCVDEPRLRGLIGREVKYTAPVAYVRFHGRNAAKWWEHEAAHERYDYLYGEDELKEWVPGIADLAGRAERVFVAFNNHYQAKAVVNARMLRRLLEKAGLI
ncbi:MAG: DUF72 domain-containing protein [Clostridia bacterium]|nr:MAG: DUF72 domain-containing protein [Clostridia bacterium]